MLNKRHVVVACPNPAIDIFATVSDFKIGVPNRILSEERFPGGKGLHVAMALAELGIEVVVVGFWGSASGQWIKEEANRYYPSLRFTGPQLASWSRSCYTFKSEGEFGDTELLGTGPTISNEDFNAFCEATQEALTDAQALVMAGSWPSGAPQTGYADLIKLAHKRQIATFLDCTGAQLTEALKQRPYAVHLNRKEVSQHFQLDFEEARKALLKQCELAVVTDGSKGLYLTSQQETVHALSKVDQVISTIGSGDCLFAGVVAAYYHDLPINEMARWGAACGAANCIRPELGMIFQKDVESLKATCAVMSS